MTDRRRWPSDGTVVLDRFADLAPMARPVPGRPMRVGGAVADLSTAPAGPRARQLLPGAEVEVLLQRAGQAFLSAELDGTCGWVAADALTPPHGTATHRVEVRATHAYARADLKSPERLSLPLGARIVAGEVANGFVSTGHGWIPERHLTPAGARLDGVEEAMKLLGTPYLWGGNSAFGIDCSGLISTAMAAMGLDCPCDSDLQRAEVGQTLDDDEELRRGDLVFWDGHVGIMTDADTLLHANAHAMSTTTELLSRAADRIERDEGKPILRRARPG
ncbi:MAG: C40 family peptidase [Paracoccaceae bacterium]